jgi:membrane protease YdiL (CAAX protease family)
LDIDATLNSSKCPQCQSEAGADDTFCGYCGAELCTEDSTKAIEQSRDVFSVLLPTLLYYFVTLLLLAVYKFTEVFPEGLEGLAWITILDLSVVIVFWLNDFSAVNRLFSLKGLKVKVVLLTVLGALLGSVVVSLIADFINLSLNDDVFYSTYLFEDTAYPYLMATLFIAVQPAIFEEITFRGFLFNNLKQVSGGPSAVYITGFVFGMMHLALISLLWLVPIGLAFGYLRNKYNTLWYGVIGHFTYNFIIVMNDFERWF